MTGKIKAMIGASAAIVVLVIAVLFVYNTAQADQRRFETCMAKHDISAEDLADFPDLHNSLEAVGCRSAEWKP